MKKYSEFLSDLKENKLEEASGKNYIDVFDEQSPFGDPVDRVHRDNLVEEIDEYLKGIENGYIEKVSVFADLPSQGSTKKVYLSDTLPDLQGDSEEELNYWEKDRPEKDEEEEDDNAFVDVEFEVVDVDKEKNLIIGMPYSLRRKKITTPINPRYVHEIYFKKVKKSGN